MPTLWLFPRVLLPACPLAGSGITVVAAGPEGADESLPPVVARKGAESGTGQGGDPLGHAATG